MLFSVQKFAASKNRIYRSGFKLGLLTTAVALAFGWQGQIFAATATDTLTIRGTAGAACSISITPTADATALAITTPTLQTINVGRVLQTCNNATGYTLDVSSANCLAGVGARLNDGAGHFLAYSVNADNTQPPDGTWEVTGLLNSVNGCAAPPHARVVGSAVTADHSDLGVVFTGNATLFPGTYQDIITVTMTTT